MPSYGVGPVYSDHPILIDHPASHGGLILNVEHPDGIITSAEFKTGFMNRGAEEIFSVRDFKQGAMLANRHCWSAPSSGEFPYVLAVEEIHGVLNGLPATGYQFIDAFPSTEEDIFNNAAGLARALVAIHSTPIEKFEDHLDTTTWKARTLEQLSVTESIVTWPERVLKQWKILLSMDELWSDPHVLCHGDLGPPHLLSREGILVGIIDFSDLQFAPAAIEFGNLLTAFGAKVLNRVLMEYCAQSNANFDIVWAGAYAYQSLGPLFTAYHGITSDQSEFVESALRSLNENS